MMDLLGYDSAGPPNGATLDDFNPGFWLGYLGGAGTDYAYSRAEWNLLVSYSKATGMKLGQIWVPELNLTENPTTQAQAAVAAALALGFYGGIILDTEESMADLADLEEWVDAWCAGVAAAGTVYVPAVYTGAHYCPAGVCHFDPLWGSTEYPAENQAIQYGPNTANTVDVDRAGPQFPFLSLTEPVPTSQEDDMLAATYDSTNDQLHVFRENADGSIQHWWQQSGGPWDGPETVTTAPAT